MIRLVALLLFALSTWHAGAQAQIRLPDKPSVLLEAPPSAWEALLQQVDTALAGRVAAADTLTRAELRELRIQQALLAQVRGEWGLVRAPVERARRLQDAESGRHMAGLLNELLAEQQLRRADGRWLSTALRERLLAMPWAEVGPVVRSMREQLAAMKAEDMRRVAQSRWDLSASFAQNNASLGFAMQLVGLRVQLLQVLPQRDALVQGLDEALRLRGDPPAAASAPQSAQ